MTFCTCSLLGVFMGDRLYSPIILFLNCTTGIEISNATVNMMQTACLGSSQYIFLPADLGGYHYNTYNIHNLWWFAVPYQNLLGITKALLAKCSPFIIKGDCTWGLSNFLAIGGDFPHPPVGKTLRCTLKQPMLKPNVTDLLLLTDLYPFNF